ncbi:MAG TPA: hypothetical protein VGI81_20715 [Tepidisphaeraceae bacterium]
MRTIGLLILSSVVAGCAASSQNRAIAPAAPPPQDVVVAPKPAPTPAPAPPVVQTPRPPATTRGVAPTTAPAVVAVPTAPPPQAKAPAPLDYRQYLLQTSGNWWLRIDRDGGGAYGYGSASEDRATFGAGAFDFLKLGQTLGEKIAGDKVIPGATAVMLSPRKGVPVRGVIADPSYIRSLFDTAKSHRQDDLAQLDHLEASFPILK